MLMHAVGLGLTAEVRVLWIEDACLVAVHVPAPEGDVADETCGLAGVEASFPERGQAHDVLGHHHLEIGGRARPGGCSLI